MTMHLPLPQYYYVPSVQAELAVNEWWQRAYEYAYWQAYAHGWQACTQLQGYAQLQAYAQRQRMLLATPSLPCNDNRAANVETPISKRQRRASLEAFIARAQRAAQRIGLAVRAIEEKTDGSRVAHFGTSLKHDGDIGNAITNPWDKVLRRASN